jgi:hypothetical protein
MHQNISNNKIQRTLKFCGNVKIVVPIDFHIGNFERTMKVFFFIYTFPIERFFSLVKFFTLFSYNKNKFKHNIYSKHIEHKALNTHFMLKVEAEK